MLKSRKESRKEKHLVLRIGIESDDEQCSFTPYRFGPHIGEAMGSLSRKGKKGHDPDACGKAKADRRRL